MKLLIRTLLPLFVLTTFAEVQAQRTRSFYQKHKDDPITVLDRTGNRRQDVAIILRDITKTAIIYSPSNFRDGILEMPLNNEELRLEVPYPQNFPDVMLNIRNEKYKGAVEMLRPFAYPQVKYIILPPEKFNGHTAVEKLLEALIGAGFLDEALELASHIDFEDQDEKFMRLSVALAEKLADAGQKDKVIRALRYVPITEEKKEWIPFIIQTAHRMRERDMLEEALVVYKAANLVDDHPHKRSAHLWLAYINLLLGKNLAAKLFIEEIRKGGEITRDDREYTLWKLILGRSHYADGDLSKAMAELSEGVVFGDIGYPWMRDLLFSTAEIYEQSDFGTGVEHKAVAANVFHQITLFYPNTPMAKKAETHLAGLPAPKELETTALPAGSVGEGSEAIAGDDEWQDVDDDSLNF